MKRFYVDCRNHDNTRAFIKLARKYGYDFKYPDAFYNNFICSSTVLCVDSDKCLLWFMNDKKTLHDRGDVVLNFNIDITQIIEWFEKWPEDKIYIAGNIVEFIKDGDIRVGCNVINFETVEKIYNKCLRSQSNEE